MRTPLITLPAKRVRAEVIKVYLEKCNKPLEVVCFTCGNAAEHLRDVGLDVIEIGPGGALTANRWWTQDEIAKAFPYRFDATSGHLPLHLVEALGQVLACEGYVFGAEEVRVPSGSGETALSVALANPLAKVVACYGAHGTPATAYNERAPLNNIVARLCAVEHY